MKEIGKGIDEEIGRVEGKYVHIRFMEESDTEDEEESKVEEVVGKTFEGKIEGWRDDDSEDEEDIENKIKKKEEDNKDIINVE
jgi:hypothetical protein